MTHSVIAGWHEAVRLRDPAGLDALLAEDIVFHSPVVFRPQVGKAAAKAYLAAALDVLCDETFRYVGEWNGENSTVIEFMSTMDGIEIDGADFITWNQAGLMASFKVMIRPLKAIEIVRTKMAERLAQGKVA
jgi:SnoaL-like protein